ncbi:MAG: putative manganese-dependent inorganic diphosphatase [Chthoniobacterales bacterium]
MQTFVIGHKNPDMDAIVSAIAYARLKQLTGEPDTTAARCGSTNERIDFVLNKFGVPSPVFISDVRPRVSDVMEREIVTAGLRSPVYDAMRQIGEAKFRGLPVVDDDGRCIGLISGFKVSQILFPPLDAVNTARKVDTSVANISATVNGTVLAGELCEKYLPHTLVVAAMHFSSLEERLTRLDLPNTVVIVGDRFRVQKLAIERGVKALIVTGGLAIGDDVIAAANAAGTTLISSPHDTATTVLLARSAVTAERMLYSDFQSIAPETSLEEARRDVTLSSQFAFPVVDESQRLIGILSKSDFLKPIPRQLILVDHNELTQAVDGASEIDIVEILDHHRLGAASTDAPILFLNRPVGSTSTIVTTCYQQADVEIPVEIAGILMAGLISDTLNLSSPTTTDIDRRVMSDLSAITGVDPTRFAEEIFSVGSPLLTMSADDAVTADCKDYSERGQSFSVAQIEELSFSNFDGKKTALSEALEAFRSSRSLLFSALLITDINTQNSVLIARGSRDFTKHIDYPDLGQHLWQMDGVVSRKKQLLPYLSSILAKMA